ncbi:hypothetical protein [Pseudoxanthomonas dokdonensis]|uniref:DUF4142 domain-containing protein n=1 Tax=Pseudoxanthomonas dokdonensis TaxID=344882 RepID=A0A0R0CKR0_9GAMM|nr:hypothetical protein [Pseudoxanthomonas dokdonensis]KRG70601.1 hypothetical protein ABB29_05950 [Pseudoxanthomonas dokdonensis]
MNTLFSGFFITLGLGIGSVISSLSATAADGWNGGQLDGVNAPRVASQDAGLPTPPELRRSESQALGIMLALSHHEREVAQAISASHNPQLQQTVARHMQQHQQHMQELETLPVDLDSDATRDLWLTAASEEAVIGMQDEGDRDGAYLQAALKCNQHALAVIDQQVLPAVSSEPGLRMVRQSRQDTLQRINELKTLLADNDVARQHGSYADGPTDTSVAPAEARPVQAP